VVQFLQQNALQLFDDLMLSGIYARLRQKTAQVQVFDFEPKLIFGSHVRTRYD
jgi:hypothetical protein